MIYISIISLYFHHQDDETNEENDCCDDLPGDDDMMPGPSGTPSTKETILPYLVRENVGESDSDESLPPSGLQSVESSNEEVAGT